MNAHAQTSVAQARREYDLAHYGDASSEAQMAALHNLMAAEQAVETLDKRCFRLGLAAADADAEAERHMAAEADAAGRAAHRRNQGYEAMAASFDREAAACRELAAKAMAEAERLRSQAASIRKAQRFGADVLAILQGAA